MHWFRVVDKKMIIFLQWNQNQPSQDIDCIKIYLIKVYLENMQFYDLNAIKRIIINFNDNLKNDIFDWANKVEFFSSSKSFIY